MSGGWWLGFAMGFACGILLHFGFICLASWWVSRNDKDEHSSGY